MTNRSAFKYPGAALPMLYALGHLLMDGLCAATVFGPLAQVPDRTTLLLVYNTLAFSTQCLVGLAADRVRRHRLSAALALGLTLLGFLLPAPPMVRIVLIAGGNSLFHVAGGAHTLEQSRGKAGPLGVFVAPGAVGLVLGTMWPGLGPVFAAATGLCAVGLLLVSEPPRQSPASAGQLDTGVLIPVLLLTAAVAVRAIGGSVVSFPWKTGRLWSLVTVLCVFAGKTAGGFVCDGLGPKKAAWISLPPAAVLIAFCGSWALPSLLGQLALNLTMPITLYLLYRLMPEAPGFAFGLAAAALWPGTIAGGLIRLTGPWQWVFTLVCFLFGLWAVLLACRAETRRSPASMGKERL